MEDIMKDCGIFKGEFRDRRDVIDEINTRIYHIKYNIRFKLPLKNLYHMIKTMLYSIHIYF